MFVILQDMRRFCFGGILFFFLDWSTVDLQDYVNYCCIAKWFRSISIYVYRYIHIISLHSFPLWFITQFSSATQSCLTLCDPMDCSTPGLPVHHQLPELTQIHVHWVRDAIQSAHTLSSPFPPAPNPSQHQSLFQWVNSSREVDKVLEFQLQHQSFQWTPMTDLL